MRIWAASKFTHQSLLLDELDRLALRRRPRRPKLDAPDARRLPEPAGAGIPNVRQGSLSLTSECPSAQSAGTNERLSAERDVQPPHNREECSAAL